MSCPNNNNNKCVSEKYSFELEHPHDNILQVIKLEQEEQARRIADIDGENHKRVLALNLSVLFSENLHATWFQRGSSFVLNLLGSVRSAVSKKASNLSTTVTSTAGDLGHKTAVNLQHTAGDVNFKAHNLAHELSEKSLETAHNLTHGLQEKGLETAQNVSAFAQEKAWGATSFLSAYSQKLKDAVSSSFYNALSGFTNNVNATFAVMEQEEERARRMTSSKEKYAIENALKVSALFKEHSTAHSLSLHNTTLLEEAERSRRVFEIKNDKAAITHANSVADMIHKNLNVPAPAPIALAEVKVEQSAEPIAKKPFAAAM